MELEATQILTSETDKRKYTARDAYRNKKAIELNLSYEEYVNYLNNKKTIEYKESYKKRLNTKSQNRKKLKKQKYLEKLQIDFNKIIKNIKFSNVKLTDIEKDNIYNCLFKNKRKFILKKTDLEKDYFLVKLLIDNNFILEKIEMKLNTIVKYLITHWDIRCNNTNCFNNIEIKEYLGFLPDKKYITKYCSLNCKNFCASERQMGINNTSHRMSIETRNNAKNKQSITMKKKIADGSFIPNITNSWAGSKVKLLINNEYKNYRSSWDAFFHLCNQKLEYEKCVIPYIYKGNKHNYIIDFIDRDNKIIYEIKPDAIKNRDINLIKFDYANKWCKVNDYKFVIIDNKWFKENFTKNINLLEGQECKTIIEKRLKQFKNEN